MSERGQALARWPALWMAALGGSAALSWEALWQIRASLAIGASALGTAITLAAAMAGMTTGSLWMGRRLAARPPANALRTYALLECVIGLAGLAMALAFPAIQGLDAAVYRAAPAIAPFVLLVAIALVLAPAAAAMGATIPVFDTIARERGTRVSLLYGLNTAGAALGLLVISFAVIPALGLTRTGWLVCGVNFAVCGLGFALGRSGRSGLATADAPSPAAAPAPDTSYPLSRASLLVFASGFATFALEIAWFRSLRAAFHSATDSFAIMLAAVLISLAAGAHLVGWLRARGVRPGHSLAAAAFLALFATPNIEQMDLWAGGVDQGYWWAVSRWLGLTLLTLGPTMFALGTVLPWLLDEMRDPARCGRLYAVNTLGSVLGSLGAAWLLLPALGFARSSWLVGLGLGALAATELVGRQRLYAVGATALGLVVAATQTSSLGRDRVQLMSEFPISTIIAYDEGPDATVSVVEAADGARALVIDGFLTTLEGWKSASYMHWMGSLPALLHPAPKNALVICFGTGQTANGVREEGIEHLDVVDLSPAVLRLAPHFASNRGVLDDPRVSAHVMDGRAWLRRSDRDYDVITLEPMPPHFAGVNALYSREFYEIMRSRLAPGGVAAQWLPLHLLPPYFAASIVGTFEAVFPDAVLWLDPPSGTAILLGRAGPHPLEPGALAERWPGLEREGIARPLSAKAIRDALVLGPRGTAFLGSLGDIISDDNQLLGYGQLRRGLSSTGKAAAANEQLIVQIRRDFER